MRVSVERIIPNDESDFGFMEARVGFYDDVHDPHQSADVVVFLEKTNLTLSDLRNLAIEKARQFLSQCVQDHYL